METLVNTTVTQPFTIAADAEMQQTGIK